MILGLSVRGWATVPFLCLIFCVVGGLTACTKEAEHVEEKKVETSTDIPKDVRVPLKIWDILAGHEPAESEAGHNENHGEKHGEAAGAESGHGEAKTAEHETKAEGGHEGGGKEGKEGGDGSYVFAEISVRLSEKNPGIIKDKTVTINLPRGGGEIDLANYITGKPGSFFVKFEFPEWEEATDKKVLFVSHSRKRKIDNQIFGSGCKELFNITDRFVKEMPLAGIKVNTTRNRHTSVLAGTFILSSKKGGQNYLTQVTFTDSANPNLLCQEK